MRVNYPWNAELKRGVFFVRHNDQTSRGKKKRELVLAGKKKSPRAERWGESGSTLGSAKMVSSEGVLNPGPNFLFSRP